MKILDTNSVTTSKLAQLKQDGVQCVIRYIASSNQSGKRVEEDEARAIAAAGLQLGLVFENYGGVNNFQHADINSVTGTQHGMFARQWAEHVGCPNGTIIWFAIDTDVVGRQYDTIVKPYLVTAKVALKNQFRIGVYACGYVCQRALDDKVVDATWLTQSMGWNGSRDFRNTNRWVLLQGPEQTIHNLSIDTDVSNGTDFGAFTPFGLAPPQNPPATGPIHDEKWLQATLNKLGATPPIDEDGDIGPFTIRAMIAYLEKQPSPEEGGGIQVVVS